MTSDLAKSLDHQNLMSPPELAPLDEALNVAPMAGTASAPVHGRPQVPTPPVSPHSAPVDNADVHLSNEKDPLLYPTLETPLAPSRPALFPPSSTTTTQGATEQVVNNHIASRPPELFQGTSPPAREHYELALYFKSNCFAMFQRDPRGWLRNEREILRRDKLERNRAMKAHPAVARPALKLPPILPAAKPVVPKSPIARPSTIRVQKPKSPTTKLPNPRPVRATPTPTRQTIRVSTTPEPRARTVAPNREDKDFEALEDLSPPLSSLPSKANSLKVDWKGNALDLSNDPNRHLLHPDELALASGLRLDCATYLTSKRRIFLRRLECARIQKEFRKTDAQQACKIDVNKASKLWQAYEKVGWLDIKWMQGVLSRHT